MTLPHHFTKGLEQYPTCIFLIGQGLVDGLPAPLGFARWGEGALLLKPHGNIAETVTVEIALKDTADNGHLIRVDGKDQFAWFISFVIL